MNVKRVDTWIKLQYQIGRAAVRTVGPEGHSPLRTDSGGGQRA